MATRRVSKSTDVPVKVVRNATPRPAPVAAPVSPAPSLMAKVRATKSKPMLSEPAKPKKTLQDIPEATRRRWMWISVGAIAVLLLIVWIPLAMAGSRGGSNGWQLTWGKIRQAFTGLTTQNQTADAATKEIRSLDQQVFPELSK